MNKIIISLIMGIFLVAIVTATVITLSNLTPVEIEEKIIIEYTKTFEGNITCDCNGKKEINCGYISETEIDKNDLDSATILICEGTKVTNIKLDEKLIKENEFGMMSNDEDKLNENACIRNNGVWENKTCKTLAVNE